MSNDLVSLNDLIKRDLNFKPGLGGKYQIQAWENCTSAKFVSFEKEIPDICIFEYDIDDFKCSLIQYSLTDEDINKKKFNMIGFLIKNKKEMVIGSLDLIFESDEKIKINCLNEGQFKIILTNCRGEKKNIRELSSYMGNGNAVHAMMEILGECLGEIIEYN